MRMAGLKISWLQPLGFDVPSREQHFAGRRSIVLPIHNMTDNISKAATLAKDPVCGMDVNPATSKHKVDHAGKSYFFCCAGCAQKFKSNPDKYLAPAARAGSSNLVMLSGPAAAPAVS